jgi:hypothetical protein
MNPTRLDRSASAACVQPETAMSRTAASSVPRASPPARTTVFARARTATVDAPHAGASHGDCRTTRTVTLTGSACAVLNWKRMASNASSETGVRFGSDLVISRRVLIADDNKDAGESLAMLLRLDGHHCRAAFRRERGDRYRSADHRWSASRRCRLQRLPLYGECELSRTTDRNLRIREEMCLRSSPAKVAP